MYFHVLISMYMCKSLCTYCGAGKSYVRLSQPCTGWRHDFSDAGRVTAWAGDGVSALEELTGLSIANRMHDRSFAYG